MWHLTVSQPLQWPTTNMTKEPHIPFSTSWLWNSETHSSLQVFLTCNWPLISHCSSSNSRYTFASGKTRWKLTNFCESSVNCRMCRISFTRTCKTCLPVEKRWMSLCKRVMIWTQHPSTFIKRPRKLTLAAATSTEWAAASTLTTRFWKEQNHHHKLYS